MNGLMMDWPLLIPSILRRAGRTYPEKPIISRWADGTIHRMTYGDLEVRVHRLMNALRTLGIRPGDRVATLAWNSHRHLELYFAVPSIGRRAAYDQLPPVARAVAIHHQPRRATASFSSTGRSRRWWPR